MIDTLRKTLSGKAGLASMILAAMFLAVAVLLAAPTRADLDRGEEAQILQLIEKFIAENPEKLRDALIGLQQREEAARLQTALSLVRQDAGDGVMGNPDGDVIIYEFSDYNCGYCKRLFQSLRLVLAEDGNIAVKVKEYPILADSSVIAARGGIAAQLQGKFAAYHTGMMQTVGGISKSTVEQVARKAGLDMARFTSDMENPQLDLILQGTQMAARALGVSGTPALVIGEQLIPGAISADELRARIKAERERRKGS